MTTWAGEREGLAYEVEMPDFSGPEVATELDRRVRASAEDAVATAQEGVEPSDGQRTLTGRSTVTTNDGRTVQVLLAFSDYLAGTAHPVGTVHTVVVDVATGQPVTLDDVFTDVPAALSALGPRVQAIAAAEGEEVTEPDGLSPRAENWAAWQTSEAGMTFSFQDYQLGGHGTRDYTVPWSVVQPLMTEPARDLLAPD